MEFPTFKEQVVQLIKEYDNNCYHIPRDLSLENYMITWNIVRESLAEDIQDLAIKETE